MRLISVLAVGLSLLCAPASAQSQADPVITHYRAYNEALLRFDLAAAETEATAALSASEASNGARTGILALNLATVRLLRHDGAGALEPAQRAMTLAEADAPGLDLDVAALTLGRAELAVSGQAGADRLTPLLTAENLDAPSSEIFAAALELGWWALRQSQFQLADTAAQLAATHASEALYGEAYGLANARTIQAAAIFFAEIGERGRSRVSIGSAEEAYVILGEALARLSPLAEIESPDSSLTAAQAAFAQALALRAAMIAKFRSDGQLVPRLPPEAEGDADGMAELGPQRITAPRCMLQVRRPRDLHFPDDELRSGEIGAVVVWLNVSPAGEVVAQSVVAQIGSEGFAEAVREAGLVRLERRVESSASCRMPQSVLVPIQFLAW